MEIFVGANWGIFNKGPSRIDRKDRIFVSINPLSRAKNNQVHRLKNETHEKHPLSDADRWYYINRLPNCIP